ncbi:Carbohydrate ABC transporter membrane protein 1, CUT1 family [Frankia canadensis]|uniref:Carbohydrate ABC transporter membrane protein 1, CUT1 family n=1 Tax=Frankia canadensis TaxID=1836972 RepID=A0A2I2KWJ7_9ACTN|nr:Carbohydrate ABC transporter membrane protein 1, CUT1 family [Frankia canadensis]SOU57331.1 Carbohydrate ABC transporter membrane protein 1, CUT1 family [Frankia canadensis]
MGWRAAALLLPAFVGIVVFVIGPALVSVFVAGTDKALTGPRFHWVGTANARAAFDDPDLGDAVVHTLVYCLLTVIPAVVLGLALALAAERVTRGRSLVRLALFLPVSANIVAMAVVFAYIFDSSPDGLANTVVGLVGIAPVDWLGDTSTALPVVALVGGWRLTSLVFIVYLAGLTAIPRSVYEAADVDGIRGLARLRHITLPLLAPTSVFLGVFVTILTVQTFETVAVLTKGGPLNSSTTIIYYMYQVGFTGSFRIGYASMIALLLLAATVALGAGGAVLGRRLRRIRAAAA